MISWQTPISRALTLTLLLISSPTLLANDLDLGVLKFGTVNWELATLQNLELDKKHGIDIKIHPMASNGATQIAFKSGSVDAIVSDWLWAMLQRSRGDKVVFVPFSSSIGSVMVAGDSAVQSLADLKGKKIGIAGGPLNKGWILLRAAAKNSGWDIKEETQQSFAAPPLLNQSLQRGQLDAVVTFWHYGARLENKGMRHLINLKELQSQMGMKSNIPMLGYVFRADWIQKHPQALVSFQAAISESKNSLKDSTESRTP